MKKKILKFLQIGLLTSSILGFFALFLVGAFIPNTYLMIGGSTSVYPLFNVLGKKIKNPEINYQYISSGSFSGLWGVLDKRLAIGFMSKDFSLANNQEVSDFLNDKKMKLKKITLARDGIIFAYQLPNDCKLKNSSSKLDISRDKIKEIYSTKNSLKWDELDNVDCGENNGKIKIMRISRENGSGTKSVFEEKILKSNTNESSYSDYVSKSSGSILKDIEQTPGIIGYLSFSFKDKIKEMADRNSQIGIISIDQIEPSIKTIEDDIYKFSRPFIGLFLEEKENELKDFLEFLQSDKTQKIIKEEHFVYKGVIAHV